MLIKEEGKGLAECYGMKLGNIKDEESLIDVTEISIVLD